MKARRGGGEGRGGQGHAALAPGWWLAVGWLVAGRGRAGSAWPPLQVGVGAGREGRRRLERRQCCGCPPGLLLMVPAPRAAPWAPHFAPPQVRGLWIDLVNLRSEEYAHHSRIPTMTVRCGCCAFAVLAWGGGPPRPARLQAAGRKAGPCSGQPTAGLRTCPPPRPAARSLGRPRRTRTAATSPLIPCSTTSTPGSSRTLPASAFHAAACLPACSEWAGLTRGVAALCAGSGAP